MASISILGARALSPQQKKRFLSLQQEFRQSLSEKERRMVPEPYFEPDAFVAFYGTKMIGFITYQQHRDVLRIPTSFVEPNFRSRMIGLKLLEHTVRFMQQQSGQKPTVVKWLRTKTGKEQAYAIEDIFPQQPPPKPHTERIGDRLRKWIRERKK